MTTTIYTASKTLFERVFKFLKSKKVSFTSELLSDTYSLTIFNLDNAQTDALIQTMTSKLRLISKYQQGSSTLAA